MFYKEKHAIEKLSSCVFSHDVFYCIFCRPFTTEKSTVKYTKLIKFEETHKDKVVPVPYVCSFAIIVNHDYANPF